MLTIIFRGFMANFWKIFDRLRLRPQTTTVVSQKGELQARDSDGKILAHDGSVAKVLVDQSSAEALTNKTIDADLNTITNIENAEIKAGAAIAHNKMAALTVSRALQSDGSGVVSASSVTSTELGYLSGVESAIQSQFDNKITDVNYLNYNNSTFDDSLGDWGTYLDLAGQQPVDGTGGSPTLTLTRSTSSPLRGSASAVITHGASDQQGQGASVAFSIDSIDQAKVLRISFDYLVDSGTFDYGDGTAADPSDLTVYVYDVTNSLLIQPTNFLLDGSGRHVTEFQSSPNSTSYRLIIHCASTNTSAFTFKLDNVRIGPKEIARGPIVTDWVQYTPTIYGTTTNPTKGAGFTEKAFWRRNGSDLEINYSYVQSVAGTDGSGSYIFSLPSGLTIDGTKIEKTNLNEEGVVGASTIRGNAATTQSVGTANVYDDGAGKAGVYLIVLLEGGGNLAVPGSSNFGLGTNAVVRISFNAKIPIQGWSSNTVSSSDSGTRTVALSVVSDGSVSGTINTTIGTSTTVDLGTVVKDTHGLYSAGTITIKENGLYYLSYAAEITGTEAADNTNESAILKNGTVVVSSRDKVPTTGLGFTPTRVTGLIECVAGDLLTVRTASSVGTPAFNTGTTTQHLELFKIQSPQSIGMADFVGCRYSTNAGQAIPNAANRYPDYEDKDYDSHGMAVGSGGGGSNLATGGFYVRIPVSGKYRCKATNAINSANFATSERMEMGIQINAATVKAYDTKGGTGASNFLQPDVNCILDLKAGDTVSFLTYQNSGASENLVTDGGYNYIEVVRVG